MGLKVIIFIGLTVFTTVLFGQKKLEKAKKDFSKNNLNYSIGLLCQNHLLGEAGLNYGKIGAIGSCGPTGPTFLGNISAELTVFNNELLIAPKIGIEKNISFIELKASLVRYYKSNIADFRFVPEIGLRSDRIGIFFGWNIAISNNKLDFISKTRFSALLNF